MNRGVTHFILTLLVLLPTASSLTLAQSSSPGAAGVRIFELAYFAEFDPVTALDLVEQMPGFNPEEQNGARGLGDVRSNILINGKRPPPKGQSIWQQLSNLRYSSVEQIELIDSGASLEIDMQGYQQVANVILGEERNHYLEISSEYSESGDGDLRQQNQRGRQVDAIGTFSVGQHEVTLRGGTSDFSNRSPAGFVGINPGNPEPRMSSMNEFARNEDYLEFSSSLNFDDGSLLSINAQLGRDGRGLTPVSESQVSSAVVEGFNNDEDEIEMSAEYRRPLSETTDLMLAVVDSSSEEASKSTFTAGDSVLSSLRNQESGETAGRARLSWQPIDSLTLRSTLSSAYNYFEGDFQLLENGVPQILDGSDSRVEEDRHSLAVEADWKWAEKWLFRGSISAGAYAIETQDQANEQDEIKGRASVAYRLRPRTTITLESQYDIGQLSLNQFLASSNLSSEIQQAGATSLNPVREWIHTLTYDQRFGDRGVLKFDLEHRIVTNPIRTVALSDSLTVSQNTSEETFSRFNASVDYPFSRFELDNLVLSMGFSIADSETVDPITGETREVPWVDPLQWNMGLELNPGDGKWSFGVNAWKNLFGDNYSLREIREFERSHEWRGFIQYEIINNLWLRTEIESPRTEREFFRFYPAVRRSGLEPSFLANTWNRRDSSAEFSVRWRRERYLELSASIGNLPEVSEFQILRPYGTDESTRLEREVGRSPRVQFEIRLYNQ